MTQARSLACGLAGALALIAAAWLSPRAIPYNMDEFVHYAALGCATAEPLPELAPLRDGCGFYHLRLPLTSTPLPLRAYYYIGSFPALPFYPFWRVLDDPVAARVQGAVFYLLFLVLAGSLLRIRASSLALAGLVFPLWLVTFVVDEGPVGLSAVLLLAALVALRRALGAEQRARACAWAAASGGALFLGLWTKLVFAWWLPLYAAFLVFELWRAPSVVPALRRQRATLAALALAFALPTLLLLTSTDLIGQPYGRTLLQGDVSAAPEQTGAVGARMVAYFLDGSRLAPRNVVLPHRAFDALPAIVTAALLAAGLWRRRARRPEMAGLAGLALATFIVTLGSRFTQWPHHFAFALLPLVLALALALDGLPGRARIATLALVAAFWGSLAARWPDASFPYDSGPEKDELLAFVRARGLDREVLQVHASWGTYYIAQLFGAPERAVVYLKKAGDDAARLRQFAEAARARDRTLLLVSSRRWDRLQAGPVETVLGRPQRTWNFGRWWAVEYDVRPGSRRP